MQTYVVKFESLSPEIDKHRGMFITDSRVHWNVYVLAYWNFIFEFLVLALPKTVGSAQTHKNISFIWIVWSTLYVYLWVKCELQDCDLQASAWEKICFSTCCKFKEGNTLQHTSCRKVLGESR